MTRRSRPQTRSERTREKLLKAFVELVLTCGYVRLSASDVAARAGVSRSTLYTHFGGLVQLLEASLDMPCSVLATLVRVETSDRDLLPLLRHLEVQSSRNAVFFREPVLSLWSNCLARTIAAALRRDPNRLRHRSPIPRSLLASVLAELQLAIIRRWLSDPSATGAETIAATLTAATRRLVTGS